MKRSFVFCVMGIPSSGVAFSSPIATFNTTEQAFNYIAEIQKDFYYTKKFVEFGVLKLDHFE